MAKYKCWIAHSIGMIYVVDANSEEEAFDKCRDSGGFAVKDQSDHPDVRFADFEHYDITDGQRKINNKS